MPGDVQPAMVCFYHQMCLEVVVLIVLPSLVYGNTLFGEPVPSFPFDVMPAISCTLSSNTGHVCRHHLDCAVRCQRSPDCRAFLTAETVSDTQVACSLCACTPGATAQNVSIGVFYVGAALIPGKSNSARPTKHRIRYIESNCH